MNKWRKQIYKQLVTSWGHLPLPGWFRSVVQWVVLPKFLVGAVAVIFDEEKHVLLFNHTYRSECPWGLPGGWLKKNEHAHEALERELQEESGYQVLVKRVLVVGGDKHLQRLDLYYACELVGGTFHPSAEVTQAAFFALDQLPACLEPFHRQVIDYALCHPERSI